MSAVTPKLSTLETFSVREHWRSKEVVILQAPPLPVELVIVL